MDSLFSAEFFTNNRQKLRTLFTGTAPIVLTANGLLQRNADSSYHFRQDSSFWYLTGIEEPDVILVMDKTKEYLIVPFREGARAAFDGRIDAESLRKRSGIEEILSDKEGWRQLSAKLKRVQHVATLAPPKGYIPSHGMYTNPARKRLVARIKEHSSMVELLDLRPHLAKMRMIKQDEELQAIKKAIGITEKALTFVQRRLEKFNYEYELEAEITARFRKQNSTHSYLPIVASGKNACTLHYISNSSEIDQSLPVLLDVGAEVEHYAADITRTYSLKPTKRQQQVADAVIEAQEYAKSMLRTGTTIGEYEKSMELFMGEKLRELGLIQSIDSDSVRKYYPHATSHFLGLDVHDVADYSNPLEPGVVLTVEPGIYIPEEGIGIRIEDNVIVTEQGLEVLSDRLPRALA